MSLCEVCGKNESIVVCCVPFVPMSCAYCKECLEADAHPWYVLVANTACMGGLEHTNAAWKEMVSNTCEHLDKTLDDFCLAVDNQIRELDEYEDTREE